MINSKLYFEAVYDKKPRRDEIPVPGSDLGFLIN